MTPDALSRATVRRVPLLRKEQSVGEAVKSIVDAGMPALPVVDEDGRLDGIFGEREFIGALFPGYLGQLSSAAFVPESIEDVIDKRLECGRQPVADYTNREHIAADEEHSDTQLAETFLHHRVLIVPVVDADRRPVGVVTRWDFFKALAQRFDERA